MIVIAVKLFSIECKNSNRISHKNISFTLILFTCFFLLLRYTTTTQLLFFICFISSMFSISSAFISVLHLPLRTYPELCVRLLVCSVCFYNGILAFSLRSLLYDTALFMICMLSHLLYALHYENISLFCSFCLFCHSVGVNCSVFVG